MNQVFLDLDGVLVDLGAQAKALLDEAAVKNMIDYSTGCEKWRNLGQEFWASCPWTSDGRMILQIIESHVGQENVVLCTRCPQCPQAAAGKVQWIMEQLPEHYGNTYMFVREKWRIQGGILVDDSEHNVDKYKGPSILVPRPYNRLRDCKTLLYLKQS